MPTKYIVTIVGLIVLAGGVFYFSQNKTTESENDLMSTEQSQENEGFNFGIPKKSAHYESNTPEHGSVLAAAPLSVVINFNFDLAAPSAISITKDGKEYASGVLVIDPNKLTMRRNLDPSAPDGLYKVTYNACWPDRSCHDGNFMFAIDRTKAAAYEDLTGRKEVSISMSEIMFKPRNIKVSPNTKITWVNDEDVEHYVNTDSHPAHTYYPNQNSSVLRKGETYSVIFTQSGLYPYHCSAHAESMKGNIIVS